MCHHSLPRDLRERKPLLLKVNGCPPTAKARKRRENSVYFQEALVVTRYTVRWVEEVRTETAQVDLGRADDYKNATVGVGEGDRKEGKGVDRNVERLR